MMFTLDYINALVNSINQKAKIKYLKDNFFKKKNINSVEKKTLPTRVINE